MRIIVNIFYNNSNLRIEDLNININLDDIIKKVKEFIVKETPNIDFKNLIEKWSELEDIKKNEGNISLRQLLRKNKKFKIGYGGYIKFEIYYEKIEVFTNLKIKDFQISKEKLNTYFHIINYLNKDEINKLSQVSKKFYYIIKNYFILFQNVLYDNSLRKEKEREKIISEIKSNINYEEKQFNLLNYYQTEKNIYLLIQSSLNYNVDIIKYDKEKKTSEIIFSDQWTNYFMYNNIIYQIKYDNKKSKINKLNENKEIKLIIVKITINDYFSIKNFYYLKEENRSFILSTNMCLYDINNRKGKIKLTIDLSKQYKNYLEFSEHCKIREYNTFYKFINQLLFISLKSFYIYNIMNKRLLNHFPQIRGIEEVFKINTYFYIRNYRNIFLLSNDTYEILYTFNKYYSNLCINNFLEIDGNLNYFQTNQNNFIHNKGNINIQKNYIKFDDNWFCYNYYNNDKFLTFNMINIDEYKIIKEEKIQFRMDRFIKKLEFKKEIKEKIKKEIKSKIKPEIFMNGKGILIINLGEYYWFFKYSKENYYQKFKRICLKTNLTFEYHNIIITSNYFIIWTDSSYKILFYEMKEDTDMKMLSMENIEEENEVISLESPIFIYSYKDEIYLLSTFNSKYFSFLIHKIIFIDNEVQLIGNIENHVILKSFLINKDEKIIYCNFLLQKKYLIIFSSIYIYITKYDSISKSFLTIFKKEFKTFGKIYIKQLNKSEYEYLIYDINNNKCKYLNIEKYI